MDKKIFIGILILFTSMIIMTGCQENLKINPNIDSVEWKELIKNGSNSKITIYHDLYDESADKWLRDIFVPSLEKKYGIKARVEKTTFDEYYKKLKSDKRNLVNKGTVDIILFNKSRYEKLKVGKLIYGPFVNKLNNHFEYQNPDDMEIKYCNGIPNASDAMLFGRDQTFMIFDKEKMDTPPADLRDLKSYLEFTNRRMDYIDPSIKTGRDFINSIFAQDLPYDELVKLKSVGDVKRKCSNAIGYLRALNALTPATGSSFPISQDELDIEFNSKVIDFTMTKTLNHASRGSVMDEIPQGSKAFALKSGTTGSAYYAVIPFNAPNKAASMITCDFLLSPSMQQSKYSVENWGNLYGVDIEMMDDETAVAIKENKLGQTDITAEELLAHRIPEIPDKVSDLFYSVWLQEVKGR